MKHELFETLGNDYPTALQQKYPHVFKKIVALWNKPEIGSYFTSLLIDTRGGRKGFDADAFKDIHQLYYFRETEDLRQAETRAEATKQLETLGINFTVSEFIKAINQGNQKLADLFVRAGINVNACDPMGNSCLQIAIKNNFTIIANLLLKAGAHADVKDASGLTPLLEACGKKTRGYKELALRLIEHGADLNARNNIGWTPLMLAISVGDSDIVALLLDYGADPEVKTPKGDNALSLAKKFGYEDIVALISDHASKPSEVSPWIKRLQ
ncbi:MAG: ankyrin repeat domain-containing protein [Methylomonas sp.]